MASLQAPAYRQAFCASRPTFVRPCCSGSACAAGARHSRAAITRRRMRTPTHPDPETCAVQGHPLMFGGAPEPRVTFMQSKRSSQSRNIAARVGQWSARHRKTAILGWILFVVAAFQLGTAFPTKTLTETDGAVGDSGQAMRITDKAYPDNIDESVLVQSKNLKSDDPAFKAA